MRIGGVLVVVLAASVFAESARADSFATLACVEQSTVNMSQVGTRIVPKIFNPKKPSTPRILLSKKGKAAWLVGSNGRAPLILKSRKKQQLDFLETTSIGNRIHHTLFLRRGYAILIVQKANDFFGSVAVWTSAYMCKLMKPMK
jgi:hypothetical protein